MVCLESTQTCVFATIWLFDVWLKYQKLVKIEIIDKGSLRKLKRQKSQQNQINFRYTKDL